MVDPNKNSMRMWGSYALAFLLPMLALLLRVVIGFNAESDPILSLFLLPILVCSLLAGLGPGLTATVFSCLLTTYFLLPPLQSFAFPNHFDTLQLSILALEGVLISLGTELLNRQSETLQQQSNLLEQAHVLELDAQGRIVFWNTGAEQLYGWTKAEAVGQLVQDLLQTQFPDSREAYMNQLLAQGRWEGELNHRHKNGHSVMVASHQVVRRDRQGRLLRILEVNNDIGSLKQAEAQVQYQANLLENVSDAIIATDVGFLITSWNMGAENLYGWMAEEVLGQSIDILDSQYYGEPRISIREKLIKQGYWNGDVNQRRKDGSRFDIQAAVRLIRNTQKQVQGVVTINRDITERKQAEQQLRQSEENFSKAFSSSPVALMITRRADGKYLEINKAYAALVGYTRTELIGHLTQEFNIFINPDQRKEIVDLLLQNGALYNYEAQIKNKSGERLTVLSSLEFIQFSGEDCILSTLVDLTERKEAEAALYAEEKRSQALIENAPDGIVLIGVDGKVKQLSSAAQRIMGYTLQEMQEKEPVERTHPDDRERVIAELGQVIADPSRVSTVQYRFLHKNGEWRWIESTFSNLLSLPSVQAIVINFQEITDRINAELAIRESEKRFRTIFERAGLGVAEVDAKSGRFLKINAQFATILGYNLEELESLSFQEITHADDLEANIASVKDMLIGRNRGFSAEKRYYRKDGSIVWATLTVTPLWEEGAPPTSQIAMVADITDRKSAEAALKSQTDRLKVLAEASHAFAAAGNNMQEVFESAARITTTYLDAGCVVRLLSADAQWLDVVTTYDENPARRDLLRQLFATARVAVNDSSPGARVVHTQQPLLIPVIDPVSMRASLAPQLQHAFDSLRPHSVIVVPVTTQERQWGSFAFWRYELQEPTFTEADLQMACDLADRAGLAISNVNLFNDAQRELSDRKAAETALRVQANRLEILADTSKALAEASDDYQAVLNIVVRRISEALNAVCTIRLISADGQWLRLVADYDAKPNAREFLQNFLPDLNLAGENPSPAALAFQKGQPVLVPVLTWEQVQAATAPDQWPFLEALHIQSSFISVPLKVQGKVIGTLILLRYGPEQPAFNQDDLVLGQELAARSALTINNVRLLAEVKEANAALEMRVADRTAQLAAVNTELVAAKIEADRANQAKSEFLSRMSHELRTPLNAILGFAQILEMNDSSSGTQSSVKHILSGGQHLLGLINEVLDIARIETGNLPLSPEPVLIGQILQEALDLITPLATQRNIKIETNDIPEHYVLADHQRLKQVLLNLLSNAVKYNRPEGRIVVAILHQAPTIRLSVTDTGPGIPAEKLGRLFQPFDRLGAEATEISGTGLGLAVSKNLVKAMNGHLGVESVVGQGSTFWLEMPIAEAPTIPALDTQGVSQPVTEKLSQRTVLYIEDNLSNLHLVEQVLSYRPALRLLTATQGGLGLELTREHHPDLVLLDMNLPDVHGSQILLQLKAEPQTQAIPVVVISADVTPGQVDRMLKAGAYAYLTKPLDIKLFLQTLDSLLT